MRVLVDHRTEPRIAPDEQSARRTLRAQIARLERDLASAVMEGAPIAARARRLGSGPRLLGLAELERARDDLVGRVQAAERALAARAAQEAASRRRVEAMLADPAAHPWARVRREELGEPGCGAWEVRPRAGLLGMLLHWWRVKLSSGCP
jgi:hypothetical protein